MRVSKGNGRGEKGGGKRNRLLTWKGRSGEGGNDARKGKGKGV